MVGGHNVQNKFPSAGNSYKGTDEREVGNNTYADCTCNIKQKMKAF
jgi:hypothetical protein